MNDLNPNTHDEEESVDGETRREEEPQRRKWPYLLGVVLTWTAIIALIVVIHGNRNAAEVTEETADTVVVQPAPILQAAEPVETETAEAESEPEEVPAKDAAKEAEPEKTDTAAAKPEQSAEPDVVTEPVKDEPEVAPEVPDTTGA